MVEFLIKGFKPFTKRSLVNWRHNCCDIVDFSSFRVSISVNSASISSSLDLILWTVEPENGIKSTRDHTFRRNFLCIWLDKKEGFFHLYVPLNWVKLLVRFVTTQCLF